MKKANFYPQRYVCVALTCLIWLGAQAQGWTPAEMIKYKRVTSPVLSAVGDWVAYTVATPQTEGEKSEFNSQIWLAKSDGSQPPRQVTRHEKQATSPAFSPDGKYLSFISARVDAKAQIYLLPLDGGEAQALTKEKGSVSSYAWSDDGKRIAFTMAEPMTEKEEKDKKEKRDMRVMDEDWRQVHLYRVEVPTIMGEPVASKRLTRGDFSVGKVDWSPDGKMIVFEHAPTPSANDWPRSDISTVPADSGAVITIVQRKGLDGSPMYSPDGKSIAFSTDNGASRWAGYNEVHIVPATGGATRKLAATYDEQPNLNFWSKDGSGVYVNEGYHTQQRLYFLPMDGSAARPILSGKGLYGSISMSKNGARFAYTYADAETPPDVYVCNTAGQNTVKISDVHKEYLKHPLGKTTVIKWKSKDGKYDIEGLLTYPVSYKQGQKVPLFLNIHGGPAGVFVENFTAVSAVYPIQAFAQQGYAVLRVNPRGSSGYGKAFRYANMNDWGYNDYDDIMGGVDEAIRLGVAHPDSLVVSGWSYGGYMTSMVITKTQRFKAAMIGAGVTNLISFNGTADIPDFLPDYFGGEFWNRREVYEKHSAMFAVQNAKTPSLIVHGEADLRVPIEQGYQMYAALKKLNVPTQMVTYPRQPHGIQEPKFIQDVGTRLLKWFDAYLKRSK